MVAVAKESLPRVINDEALSIFDNFVERIEAALLTSTMDDADASAGLKKQSREQKQGSGQQLGSTYEERIEIREGKTITIFSTT